MSTCYVPGPRRGTGLERARHCPRPWCEAETLNTEVCTELGVASKMKHLLGLQ